jgi:hypothetical protein
LPFASSGTFEAIDFKTQISALIWIMPWKRRLSPSAADHRPPVDTPTSPELSDEMVAAVIEKSATLSSWLVISALTTEHDRPSKTIARIAAVIESAEGSRVGT